MNTLSATAWATPSPTPTAKVTCQDVIKACDQALEDKNKAIEKLNLGLAESTKQAGELSVELDKKEKQLSAWYRNPFILIGLGLLGGVIIAK
jgi:hypothetical protein